MNKEDVFKEILRMAHEKDADVIRFCQSIINLTNGTNNSNPESNGEHALARMMLPMAKTVFDVGTNAGEWTKFALGVNPSVNIHCFEASKIHHERLLNSGFSQNVSIIFAAVCDQVGYIDFHIFDEKSEGNSIYKRHGLKKGFGLEEQKITESVPSITIDYYCQVNAVDCIDFLKIDVEGAEIDVLSGAKTMFSEKRVKVAVLEYGATWIPARKNLKDLHDFAGDVGYSIKKIYPNYAVPCDDYDVRMDNFAYQNWMLSPK